MATLTPNYSLRKPATTGGVSGLGDAVNAVTDISDNMDLIDTALDTISDKLNATRHAGHAPLDDGTVATSSYTATRTGGTSPVGFSFTAPTSGIVTVCNSAGMIHSSSSTAFMLTNFELRTGSVVGSGTLIVDPTGDNRSIQHAGTTEDAQSRVTRVTGLTGGSLYNVRLVFRTQSGTMTVGRVETLVIPSA